MNDIIKFLTNANILFKKMKKFLFPILLLNIEIFYIGYTINIEYVFNSSFLIFLLVILIINFSIFETLKDNIANFGLAVVLIIVNAEFAYLIRTIDIDFLFNESFLIFISTIIILNVLVLWKFLRWISEIVLMSGSILITLLCFELILCILFGNSYYGEHSREARVMSALRNGYLFDSRSISEVIQDLRRGDKEVYPSISAANFWGFRKKSFELDSNKYIPISNISNATIVVCNESGKYQIYKTDEIGFNNPINTLEKASIVFLGDSFVNGACVKRESNLTSAFNNGSVVLNLGVGGNCPVSNLAIWREISPYVKKLNTTVYFHFEGNDLTDLPIELEDDIMKQYMEKPLFSQDYYNKKEKINSELKNFLNKEFENSLLEFSSYISKLFRIKYFIRKAFLQITKNDSEMQEQVIIVEDEKSIANLKKVILQIKNDTEKINGRFYFVYLPEYARYAVKYENRQFDLVKRMADENGIEFINIVDVFAKQAIPLSLFPFGLNGHYNEKGYSLVSEYIFERLSKDKN